MHRMSPGADLQSLKEEEQYTNDMLIYQNVTELELL